MTPGAHSSDPKAEAHPASAAADELAERLGTALRDAGFAYRLARPQVVEKLEVELEGLREQGLVSDELLDRYRQNLTFSCAGVCTPRTLVVAALPSPAVKVRFQLEEGPFEAIVPPTYLHTAGRQRCLDVLRGVLGPAGFAVGQASGPVKLLAVHSGLARYGRNNLAYVPGMGSYARLDVFCTDADLGAKDYHSKGSLRLSCCPPCRNCHHVCPTGCIPYDGTVIDATRCLTYLNENEGEWPAGLDPTAHNCLVGCMLCHALCPHNRYYLRNEKVVEEFDREETEVILRGLPAEGLPPVVREKLRKLDLEEYSSVLGRNLRALVAAEAARAQTRT